MEFKKWLIIGAILILALISIWTIYSRTSFTNFIFNSRAVQDTVSVSVQVVAGDTQPPNITLHEPSSRNYIWGNSLWIWYSVVDDSSNVSGTWYNLDNGTNYTLPTPTGSNFTNSIFNASNGNHVFYMFANDTRNNINNSVNVNFTVTDYSQINNSAVDSNGNLIFTDPTINEFIKNISGLDATWTINFTLYDNETPSDWSAPGNVGTSMLHFEIFANTQDDTSGSYTMHFNLSTGLLGGINPTDIRGFFFNNGIWNELTTTVKNSDSDPVEFSVVLTHLSRFLIGEKGSGAGTGGGVGGEGDSGGRGLPAISGPDVSKDKKDEEVPEKPEGPKVEFPKPPFILKLREIQELPLLNIFIVFIILAVFVLIINWFGSKSRNKKHRKKKGKNKRGQ